MEPFDPKGDVAQVVEQSPFKRWAKGSSPFIPIKNLEKRI